MARVGSFLGPTQVFGAPLSLVLPPDNNVSKSRYDPALQDPSLKLTDQQKSDLQDEIDQLYAALQVGRDLPA